MLPWKQLVMPWQHLTTNTDRSREGNSGCQNVNKSVNKGL